MKTEYPVAGSRQMSEFAQAFLQRYNYPENAVSEFMRVLCRLEEDRAFASEIAQAVEEYMFPDASGIDTAREVLARTAKKYSENEYTLDFVFVLCCLPVLKERYTAAGYPEELFYETCDDLRCKNGECAECRGVPGTFVLDWYDGILAMRIFALGRFEYELFEYTQDEEYVTACGKVLHKGDNMLNLHIPSSGVPLTDEVRYDSYRRAHAFFSRLFSDGRAVFCCNSWLLFPGNREILPEGMNIRRFMNDFETASYKIWAPLNDLWRIFGRYADCSPEELPTDTVLRKAYAQRLHSGGTLGKGFGYIVFDGEKILGKDDNHAQGNQHQ